MNSHLLFLVKIMKQKGTNMKTEIKHMQRISIIWGCLLFLLVAGVTVIGILYKKETKEYKDFEKRVVEQSYDYLKVHNLEKITLAELQEENVIESLVVNENTCEGYIEKNDQDYKAFIKCGKYKTQGYQ